MQIFLKIKPIDFEAQSKQMDSLSILCCQIECWF